MLKERLLGGPFLSCSCCDVSPSLVARASLGSASSVTLASRRSLLASSFFRRISISSWRFFAPAPFAACRRARSSSMRATKRACFSALDAGSSSPSGAPLHTSSPALGEVIVVDRDCGVESIDNYQGRGSVGWLVDVEEFGYVSAWRRLTVGAKVLGEFLA